MLTSAGAMTVLQERLAVMGSAAELTLVGGAPELLARAGERLHELERRWSRFRPESEVSRLNAQAGTPLTVSADTLLLVDKAKEGWRRTGGRYDPMLLAALRRAGYTEDFRLLRARAALRRAGDEAAQAGPLEHDRASCGRIAIDRRAVSVCLPPGSAFDPGGIGKGLAADLVSAELAGAGVPGGCVNVGGDLRVWGPGPRDRRWRVGAVDRTLAMTDVGVATSGTRRRAWLAGGRRMHHLIDPSTAEPARTDVTGVTVVAPAAWQAEVYATAAVTVEAPQAVAQLRRWGVEGVVVDAAQRVHATSRLRGPA